MFSMKDITQLIWYAHGIAYPHIHIIVRMTIYPKVNTAILDIIFLFYGEGSVCLTIGKLGTLHLKRRYMMSDNYLSPGVAGWNCFFQKRKAPSVLTVEVCKREKLFIEEEDGGVAGIAPHVGHDGGSHAHAGHLSLIHILYGAGQDGEQRTDEYDEQHGNLQIIQIIV